MAWQPPLATLEEAKAREATEFAGKAKGIAGYPQEGPPAPLTGSPQAEAPQHPPPPPVAPLRCRTLPQSILRIGPFFNKIVSDYGTTPPDPIPIPLLDAFFVCFIHSITPFGLLLFQ